jgi:antibiotic biosynthesis monooxygenase (ABM) superfamily enzyme
MGEASMIGRVWHGWTTHGNADAYENLLRTEIFGGIFEKNIPGFERIELFRRNAGDEVEFMTIMWFASIEAVKAFVGEDYEVAYVPAAARAVLKRFDARSQHYDAKIARAAAG